MKNKTLISIFVFGLLFLLLWLMYFANPSKAEVDRYFEKNKCYSSDYCTYYMRRDTGMLFGQIFKIPLWWLPPNFILYTTTPFNYYHQVNHNEDEYYAYTWVDTKGGRFVYNAVSGGYVKEIDDKVDPAKKWYEDMDKKIEELKRLSKENKTSVESEETTQKKSNEIQKYPQQDMIDDMYDDLYECEYKPEYNYITDRVEIVLKCPTLLPDYEEDIIDSESQTYKVTTVIDGDTIVIDTGESIRLIGINSPEVGEKCYEEAKEELEDLILGKEVTLESDIQDKDKYGRLLRYIYADVSGEEDMFINFGMVFLGLAYSYPFGNTYDAWFEEAELNASSENSGCLWEDYDNSVPICSSNYYNCVDFSTQAEAQTVMIYCGNDDIHYLDGDDDGIACESLR